VPELSIASFNTHYGFRPRPHPARTPYDVVAALERLDADVVVIQELFRADGETGPLDAAAQEAGLTVHHELTGRATQRARWPRLAIDGEGTVGIAVLARLPVHRIGTIPLGPTPGDPSPARTELHVELDVGGEPLRLVGVHLTSRLPYGPPAQLRRLARGLRGDKPDVIAGDCNFWTPGVRGFLRSWRRGVRGRTWPARRPHSQIDHILVRPDIEVRRGEVLPDVGSDHRPVRTEIRW
jgi:endonuclease/exonuclease/phosphatase family metal-dependent hydrolase